MTMTTIDCLMNAMVNPVFTAAIGGLLGWLSIAENAPDRFLEEKTVDE